MSDQPPLTVDAVEVFVASLRQRSVPINTIKSYAHDLRLFVQSVPADLPTVTAETIQDFLATFAHLSIATRRRRYPISRAGDGNSSSRLCGVGRRSHEHWAGSDGELFWNCIA